jgi:hypothetical protein
MFLGTNISLVGRSSMSNPLQVGKGREGRVGPAGVCGGGVRTFRCGIGVEIDTDASLLTTANLKIHFGELGLMTNRLSALQQHEGEELYPPARPQQQLIC